jgi:predicted AAA+ superfamily ATPase
MNPKKVYTIDPGFASRIGFNFSKNKGRILENIVFLELLRRGKNIFYNASKNECDFVIKKGLEIVEAIQVCYRIDVSNEKREFAGLLEAMETYKLKKGLLLTYDTENTIQIGNNEISILPVWKWLLKLKIHPLN